MARNLPYKHEGSKKTNNPSVVHGREVLGGGWGDTPARDSRSQGSEATRRRQPKAAARHRGLAPV